MADVDIATELASVSPGSSVNVWIRVRSKPVGVDEWPHRFCGVSLSANIWKLPIDANRIRVTGTNSRVTDGVWSDASPSISTDGTRLVYDSNRSGAGNETIWIQDFGLAEWRCWRVMISRRGTQ